MANDRFFFCRKSVVLFTLSLFSILELKANAFNQKIFLERAIRSLRCGEQINRLYRKQKISPLLRAQICERMAQSLIQYALIRVSRPKCVVWPNVTYGFLAHKGKSRKIEIQKGELDLVVTDERGQVFLVVEVKGCVKKENLSKAVCLAKKQMQRASDFINIVLAKPQKPISLAIMERMDILWLTDFLSIRKPVFTHDHGYFQKKIQKMHSQRKSNTKHPRHPGKKYKKKQKSDKILDVYFSSHTDNQKVYLSTEALTGEIAYICIKPYLEVSVDGEKLFFLGSSLEDIEAEQKRLKLP